jgi:hypothetical protein
MFSLKINILMVFQKIIMTLYGKEGIMHGINMIFQKDLVTKVLKKYI